MLSPMRPASVFGDGRSGRRRAGAVLVVLLTTLLHVLACAHGPVAADALRADSLLIAAPVACAPAQSSQTSPTRDADGHCWGLDEPTTQPPRAAGPVDPPVPDVLASALLAARAPAAPAAPHPSPPAPPAPAAGQERARLGVWRT